jgi:hypothetical protein
MEKNVILQVILNDNDALEIRVGGSDKVPPLMMVGILEQLKMQILTETDSLGREESYNPNQSYEA